MFNILLINMMYTKYILIYDVYKIYNLIFKKTNRNIKIFGINNFMNHISVFFEPHFFHILL
jgi:hypothetical protein